jgi:hypothetical protein
MARIIRIKAQPHAFGGRFCRAGLCFGIQPTELAEADLSPEQLAAFQAEPMLVVEIAEELKPTPPQAKAEAEAKAKEGAKEEGKTADTPKETPPAAKAAPEAPAAPGAVAPASNAKPEAKADAKPAKPAQKEGGK